MLAPNSTGIDSIDFNDECKVEKYTVSDIRLDAFANAAYERPLLTCFAPTAQSWRTKRSSRLHRTNSASSASVPIEIETAGSELTNNDVPSKGGSRLTRIENIERGRDV